MDYPEFCSLIHSLSLESPSPSSSVKMGEVVSGKKAGKKIRKKEWHVWKRNENNRTESEYMWTLEFIDSIIGKITPMIFYVSMYYCRRRKDWIQMVVQSLVPGEILIVLFLPPKMWREERERERKQTIPAPFLLFSADNDKTIEEIKEEWKDLYLSGPGTPHKKVPRLSVPSRIKMEPRFFLSLSLMVFVSWGRGHRKES